MTFQIYEMLISDITGLLEAHAPLQLQEPYDNSGLITGSRDWEVKKILICIDTTEEVIDEAISKGCNLIISHHPIVFSGLKILTGSDYIQRTIIKAIKNDIAIYACHTNLDNVREGVNAKICEKLNLTNTRILSSKKQLLKKLVVFCPEDKSGEVRKAIFSAGAGTIGAYDECSVNSSGTGTFRPSAQAMPFTGEAGKRSEEKEVKIETIVPYYLEHQVLKAMIHAHPYEEVAYDLIPLDNKHDQIGAGMIGELQIPQKEADFLHFIKKQMKATVIRHTALTEREVKKVAVCGGSGSFLLKNAMDAGADVFITGDFKYHQFFDAENKILVADIGHYESEQFTTEIFYNLILKKFPTFAVSLSEINTNPVKYL